MVSTPYKKFFDIEALIKRIKRYLPKFDVKKFRKAYEFAEEAHRGQMRKDKKTPYLAHPIQVVDILVEHHADEDILISALLHDVPEDTKYSLHDVKELFGSKIEFLVNGITKLSKVHYQHNMPERQIESLKKLFLHSTKDPRVILIKLADRLHNMRTLENVAPEKQLRIARETLEIFVPIANLLGIQSLKSELEDLCFKFLFPTEYCELSRVIAEKHKNNSKNIDQFIGIVKKAFQDVKIEAEISERKRNLFSIYKKLSSTGKTVKDVKDIVAIRILVGTIPHCYEALGLIHGLFKPNVSKFKDYIANPKVNKYQSLHTTVFGVEGVPTEVQIRTEKMQLDASYGIASNFFKNRHKIDADTRSAWVKKIVDIEKIGQSSNKFIASLKGDVLQDRIFVFTPRGETIDLPKGACAIDFAYVLSTNTGNYAAKAEINGDIVPITSTLKSGDVVRVLTSKFAYPLLSWLLFVKTTLANEKIHKYLRKTGRNTKIKEGRRLLQKEFDIAGLGLIDNMSFKRLNRSLVKHLGKSYNEIESLLVAVGEGNIDVMDIVKAVQKNGTTKDKGGTDQIVNIKVIGKNRFGLLKDISNIFYKYALDMRSLKGWASSHLERAEFNAQIVVSDLKSLASIFSELEQIDDVQQVHRIAYRVVYGVYALIAMSIFVWIVHPFILSAFLKTNFAVMNKGASSLIIYFVLLIMLSLVLFVTHMMNNYIPYVRNKKILWMWAFGVPVVAVISLFADLYYFDFDLSWVALLAEVGMIYTYLIFSFLHFKKYFPN